MIIDMHVHVWDEGYQPAGYKRGMARAASLRRLPFRDPAEFLPKVMSIASDPEGTLLVEEIDAAGVDAVVAMTVDMGIAFGEEQDTPPRAVMEHHADLMQRYPGRFFAFFGMDPRRPETLELLPWALDEAGFKGVKLYPACGYEITDPVCRPIVEACIERNLPVLVHTASVSPPLRPALARPAAISEPGAVYPGLTLIYGHAGYRYWWEEAIQVARSHPSAYIELSQWSEEINKDPELFVTVLSEMRDRMGAHRILMGTDFAAGPATVGRGRYPGLFEFMRMLPAEAAKYGKTFTQEEVDLILGGNAARLLHLDVGGAS